MPAACGRAAPSEASGVVAVVRGLDWWLLRRDGRARRLRALGDRRHHAPRPAAARRAAQAIYAAAGGVVFVARAADRPGRLPAASAALIFGTTIGLMLFVLVAGAATRGSRRWIDVGFFRFQPSEFGKVLFALFLAGVPRRPRRSGSTSCARRSARSRSPRSRSRSSSSSPTSARRSSTRPCSPPCCSSRACAGCTWRVIGSVAPDRRARRALVAAGGRDQRAQAVPGRAR